MSMDAGADSAVPLVGLIRNPRSHRNKGHAPEMAGHPNVLTEAPKSHAALTEVLAGFKARGIAYLAVDGGDGTVRDVLTCGAEIFGAEWPELIVLPKGKTNALTVDLGLPNAWSLPEALAAAAGGRRVIRQPLHIVPDDPEAERLLGFFFGAGVFTLCIEAGQEAHRLGAFNSFAVGLTIFWGIFQALFGLKRNKWRAGTSMRLVDQDGADIPHSRRGRPGVRFLLLATTFERFPLGMLPFGRKVPPGIKLGILDWPVRRVVAMIPAIMLGFFPRFLTRHGAHRLPVESLRMELGGGFVLDGETYPAGGYTMDKGPALSFVVP